MDERAWEYLCALPVSGQATVINDFRPRRDDDTDYSAAVTAFVRSIGARHGLGGGKGAGNNMAFAANMNPGMGKGMGGAFGGVAAPAQQPQPQQQHQPASAAQLEAFRARFPMDDRAYDYLSTCPGNVQSEVMLTFSPRNMQDTDYSRPITSFIKQVRARCGGMGVPGACGGGGFGGGLMGGPMGGAATFGGGKGGSGFIQNVPFHGAQMGGVATSQVSGTGCCWLKAFKTCFPMDARALDFLEQSPMEVQESVILQFNPRRPGENDYSGAITSFVKRVRMQAQAGQIGMGAASLDINIIPPRLMEAFKQRYPMDERAAEFLAMSPVPAQRAVLENFKPKVEGEADYSRLITSFLKTQRFAQ